MCSNYFQHYISLFFPRLQHKKHKHKINPISKEAVLNNDWIRQKVTSQWVTRG